LWKKSFLDLPELVPGEQNTPEIPRKTLQEAFLGGSPEDRLLWGLLAGSGLRIGEALAVTRMPDGIGNYWNTADRTITVNIQRHENGNFGPTKSVNGHRIVDLCQSLNDFMLKLAPAGGFLFASRERAARKRFDKFIPHTGFHSFRRFRATHLDNKNVPIGLRHYWLGQAMPGIDVHYVKPGSNVESRREWTEQAGLGFELPESA
jgi:integrase